MVRHTTVSLPGAEPDFHCAASPNEAKVQDDFTPSQQEGKAIVAFGTSNTCCNSNHSDGCLPCYKS